MSGINFVTNENGVKTAILIDLNVLREKKIDGRMVTAYLDALEDIEDNILTIEIIKIGHRKDIYRGM
jgi:hypothetical protein